MRCDDLILDDDQGEGGDLSGAIAAVANSWLKTNSPPHCPFAVSAVTTDGAFWTIHIASPARTLGGADPAKLEADLEKALEAEFPDETFLIMGAQREGTKRRSLRGR
jgi:hypothetical protein